MQVDKKGIARTSRALGGEGTTILLLRTPEAYDRSVLDGAIRSDVEGPANGGWFFGTTGWLLLVEGLPSEVDPWVEDLATRLEAAGVQGTLTGANAVAPPTWARFRPLPLTLFANIGFRLQSAPTSGWACGNVALGEAVAGATEWLDTPGAKVQAIAALRAAFWADREGAARLMTSEVTSTGRGSSGSYNRDRREVRHVSIWAPSKLTLSFSSDTATRLEAVAALRSGLLSLPVARTLIATISHRDFQGLRADMPGTEHFDARTFMDHPELWGEFTLEPSGIQLLSDQHLDKAHDLSAWTTRRLDDTHFLLEARDLDPWYVAPTSFYDPLDPELTRQARDDFGDMILTRDTAFRLGLASGTTTRPEDPSASERH